MEREDTMKRFTKMTLTFCALIMISFTSISAASVRVAHNNIWVNIVGAKGVAQDTQANTAISYHTVGQVTSMHYGMSVYVMNSQGKALPGGEATSNTVGVKRTALFVTNTAAGHVNHYHQLTSVYSN